MSERERDNKATLVVASIMGNLADKSWLSGISNLVAALDEPDRYAGALLERLVGSFLVPTGVAQLARTVDPVQREVSGIGEALQNRIPGLSSGLLPRRDIWGREIVSEGGIGPDMLSPVWVSTQLDDPVNAELMQLDYAPGYPQKKVGGIELSPAKYDEYVRISGESAHANLSALVASDEWRSMDDDAKVDAAKRIVSDARRAARTELFNGGKSADDPWSAFPDARSGQKKRDPFEAFPDAPQRDVMGKLEAAIPGVRFTSGFRSAEYQEEMRRRGYKPAANSLHLEGAALDMLPPPGRSMSWLREQVRRVEPNASLLVHDGHLHAEFPGWQGAPAIGNALASGIVNPATSGN